MISDFGAIIGKVLEMLKYEFVLFGYTLSFWDIGIWCIIVTVLLLFISQLINS